MPSIGTRTLVASLAAAMIFSVANSTLAQNGEQKSGEKPQQSSDPKDVPKRPDDFAEAQRVLGGPAANPECLWLGRRVVSLLWRDDLDTAFRHLDLYDRFGCPAGHIQATFRCLVRQGLDPKATDTLNSKVHACWLNPSLDLQGTAAVPTDTTNR
jgi:hypothetical protein